MKLGTLMYHDKCSSKQMDYCVMLTFILAVIPPPTMLIGYNTNNTLDLHSIPQEMAARGGGAAQRPNGIPREKVCQFKLVLLGKKLKETRVHHVKSGSNMCNTVRSRC